MNRLVHGVLLVTLAALAVGHILYFGDWVVEDAAISWAYARNLSDGWGLVPWIGGERVEGYSNPTWVALIALLDVVGVHPFYASRWLATTMTAGTVVLVHEIARKVSGGSTVAGLTAAALFAVNTQVGIFGAAGLENPLFNLLLATGIWTVIREQEQGGHPLSAWAFLGLALTRPEGLAYGFVAGVLTTGARIRAGRPRQEWTTWWLVLLAPLGAYHLVRWGYFAWALPSTAYAKLPNSNLHLTQWFGLGWRYARMWADASGQAWFLPLAMLAVVGVRDRAAWVGLVAIAGALALYGSGWWEWHRTVDQIRCAFPLLAGAALWFASLTTEHGKSRGLIWAMAMISGFFAVYAKGDWMGGSRWFAMASVTLSVLIAVGLTDLAELVGRRASETARRGLAVAVAVVGLGLFAQQQVEHTRAYAQATDLDPWMVRERVFHADDLAQRLQLDRRPRLQSVDMGGLMMFSDLKLNDVVGLIDIPIAQHKLSDYQRDFWGEYVLGETRPDFLYHGPPMERFKAWPEFTSRYYVGRYNWRIRRDLLFSSEWIGPGDRRVTYDGTVLVGWDIPAQGVPPGSQFYLELGIDNRDDRSLRIEAFLVDEGDRVVAQFGLPLYGPPTPDWPDDAFYHGRWELDLPRDLGPGKYRIGFALRTVDALNAPVGEVPEGVQVGLEEHRLRYGEVVFADGLVVVPPERALELAETDRKRALDAFAAGACEAGQRRWFLARRHGLDDRWTQERRSEVDPAWAGCWMARADAEPAKAVDHLLEARERYGELPGLDARISELATQLRDRAEAARDARKIEVAYAAYRDSLRLDPYQPWVRREAEKLRTIRLSRRQRHRRQAAPSGNDEQ